MALLRTAERHYRTWTLDSHFWDDYVPKPGDIVIATAPKCGTTWMQQIVSALLYQDDKVRPLNAGCPWVDRRFGPAAMRVAWAGPDAPPRRMFKSHLPADGLPIFDDVQYIHVARDGRDAFMSMHNHFRGFTDAQMSEFDAIGLADPDIAQPYPRIPDDPRSYFHHWLTTPVVPGHSEGSPQPSYFSLEASWWRERHQPNVLLVHYADLKADLDGEMRRVTEFLDIEVDEAVWGRLVASATFATMKRGGATLVPHAQTMLTGGADQFFNKGMNRGWEGVLLPDDLALYAAKVRDKFTPELADWIGRGRAGAGDPALVADAWSG